MENSEFSTQMRRLTEAFNKTMPDVLMVAYWDAVKRWDAYGFAYAVTKSMQEDERFPKLGKLREYYSEQIRKEGVFNQEPQPTFLCRRCGESFGVPLAWLMNDFDVACPCYAVNTHAKKCNTRYNLQYLQTAWSGRGNNLQVNL